MHSSTSTSSLPLYFANQSNEDRFFKEPPVQLNQEDNQLPSCGVMQPKDDFDCCISHIDNSTEQHPTATDDILTMWDSIHSE